MRYIWPVILVLFLMFSIDFATQNPEPVVVRYSLDWINYGFSAKRPLFVTLYLTLAVGILFSVFYFLIYHTRLLARIRKLRGEIKRLQKQLKEEQDKTEGLRKETHELKRNTQSNPMHTNLSPSAADETTPEAAESSVPAKPDEA